MNLRQAIEKNDVVTVEKIIKDQLKKTPQDIQLWLKLSITELQFPYEDYESSLKCINEIYKLSPQNIDALILEAGVKWHNFGFIDEKLYDRLKNVKSNDNRKMAIIYYLQSLYYHFQRNKECEKLKLEKCINLCDKFVYPCEALGKILLSESKMLESKKMFMLAVRNVQKVYEIDDIYDFTDVENYIAEYITGTAITKVNYDSICEWKNT